MSLANLTKCRSKMRDLGINLFIVLSCDAHSSEYVSKADERRAYISGFTGSAGSALISQEAAYLWTDGRYFLQAEKQLGKHWTLMKSGFPDVLELPAFIAKNFRNMGCVVGVDPLFISSQAAKELESQFDPANIRLVAVKQNPVDEVWMEDEQSLRPAMPMNPCVPQSIEFTGVSHNDKIAQLQEKLKECGAAAVVLSMLDEIAWLFNIRGSDVACNPVCISYAVITVLDGAHFFIDPAKLVNSEILDHLQSANIVLHQYNELEGFLENLKCRYVDTKSKIMADVSTVNWSISRILQGNCSEHNVLLAKSSIISLAKAIKTPAEITGTINAHIRDGVALTAFLIWLQKYYSNEVSKGAPELTECEIVRKVEGFRNKMKYHQYPSFDTISGYGPNGAIIHYRPDDSTCSRVGSSSLFLLDSGSQYLDGTTDVTRTVCLGDVNAIDPHLKSSFTKVLKGHIALADLVFPKNTLGSSMDILARASLWRVGLDYGHGTGHGVGSYLNVHEGPQGISFRKRENEVGFVPGMITSIEPGYYEQGSFGIRIENLYVTAPAQTPFNFQNKGFCKFEPLTLAPFQVGLINLNELTVDERVWLNIYHAKVREKLMCLMSEHFPEYVEDLKILTEEV